MNSRNALSNVNLRHPETPQTEQASKRQQRNNAGGFSFVVKDSVRFNRFLITGASSGTFYIGSAKHAKDEANFVAEYIAENGVSAVAEAVRVSTLALAPSNDSALFVLAVALNSDDLDVKRAARQAVPRVARTSTHLWTLCDYLKNTGGWGSAKVKSVADWYTSKSDDALAYQVVKYRQRNGWTHRDTLRLSHPKGINQGIVDFILTGEKNDDAPEAIINFFTLSNISSEKDAVRLIREMDTLSWEFLPTELLKSPAVWRELVIGGHTPLKALIRNIKRFANIGAFYDNTHEGSLATDISGTEFTSFVAQKLVDEDAIVRSKIHPIDYLKAVGTLMDDSQSLWYRSEGKTPFESISDSIPGRVIEALEDGYIKSFKNVEKIPGRALIGLDVSGSMSFTGANMGSSGLDCAQAGAALIQALVKNMDDTKVMAFSHDFVPLRITKNSGLSDIIEKTSGMAFGGTDTSLPILYAEKKGLSIDAFIIITDNDTWAGGIHTHEALKRYRDKINPHARMFVIAVAGGQFSVSDPDDPRSIDISGFDSSVLQVIESSMTME